jgi:hypothetical protein
MRVMVAPRRKAAQKTLSNKPIGMPSQYASLKPSRFHPAESGCGPGFCLSRE